MNVPKNYVYSVGRSRFWLKENITLREIKRFMPFYPHENRTGELSQKTEKICGLPFFFLTN